MKRFASVLLAGSLAAACSGDDDAGFDGPANMDAGIDAPGYYGSIPANINRNLDVVLVVDNSGSMLAEQQALANSFPQFISVLQQVAGGLPNLHLGVISSDVGSAGQAQVPNCIGAGDDGNLLTGPPGNTCASQFGLQGNFISDVASPDGSRDRNFTGDMSQLFTCMAQLGTTGCGFEQHLEAVFRSLQPGKNPGFLREDAHLAVIVLADEDDCSTELGTMFGDPNAGVMSELGPRTSFRCHEFGVICDNDPNPRAFGVKNNCRPRPDSPFMFEVERYVSFLRNLKAPGGTSKVIVAGIAGQFDTSSRQVTVGPDPVGNLPPDVPLVQRSCGNNPDPNDGATPPVRLRAFLDGFPEHNVMTSVCDSNLAGAMVDIAQTIHAAIGDPCVDATLADSDPSAPGLQPTCTVKDVFGDSEIAVPACQPAVQGGGGCEPGGAGTPCWCMFPDAVTCAATPGNLAFQIVRGGAVPPLGTETKIFCETE